MSRTCRAALLTLAAILVAIPAGATNTITGTIKNCSGVAVPNVLVYIGDILTTGTCDPYNPPGRIACRVTSQSGTYSVTIDQNSNAAKICVTAVPEGDGWGGCASCSASKCCNGSAPIPTANSVTIPANANNNTYTVDVTLSYSGACNTSDGQVNNFGAVNCLANGLELQWTAPSDSGCTVVAYDVRYSTSAIDASNWGSATQASGEPTPSAPSVTEDFTINGLAHCTLYYLAIKAQLRSGSYSPLTTGSYGRTLCDGSSECVTGPMAQPATGDDGPLLVFALGQNNPNPFHDRTDIWFTVPHVEAVRIEVFDLLGRKVRTVADTRFEVGRYVMTWDHRDDSGNPVHRGIYMCRMTAGGFKSEKKMVFAP